MLDTFDALQNDENLNSPKQEERDPRVKRNIEDRRRKRSSPRRKHHTEKRVERGAADPRLNTKPPTRHNRAQHRRHVGSLCSERSATEHWKRDTVLRPRMRVKNHRNEHDRVAKQDRNHRLPPVHARFDETARERIGGDHYAHADPKGSDIPGGPCSLFDCGWREIAVPEGTV